MKPQSCIGCPLYGAPGPIWGEGSKNASLVIIGQNPGPDEVTAGRPFVGTSGQVLNRNLQASGISRASAYVTNVVKCFTKPGTPVPPEAVRHCYRTITAKEIEDVKPKVVLTLGQEAFNALCSPKHLALIHVREKAKKDPSYWLAGAPYHHPFGYIVVGAAHPAFVARTGFALEPKFKNQLQQARDCLTSGAPTVLDVSYNYNPSDREVTEYIDYMLQQPAGGCDIETPYRVDQEEDEIDAPDTTEVNLIGLAATDRSCIGVNPDQFHLLTEFFNPSTSRPPHRLWCYGGQTEVHHLTKLYDDTPGVRWQDGLLAFHLLWPDERSKDLGTCMAMYTRWGYHKNLEHRDPIWYNTLDTIGCLEAGESMRTELSSGFGRGMLDLFESLNDCIPQVLPWQHVGVRYDQGLSDKYEIIIAKALAKYEEFWRHKFPLVDWSSPKQLVQLFTMMGYPPAMKNRKRKNGERYRSATVDEDELEKIAAKGSSVAKLIIMMRKMKKTDEFLNQAERGRLRCRAKIHGQAGGRIQTINRNIQQWPEEMLNWMVQPRNTVLPDHEDDCIVAADFSQIEFWLYAWYAKSEKLIKIKDSGEYLYGQFYEDIWQEPFFLPWLPRTKGNRDDAVTPPWKLLVAKSWPLGFIYGRGVPGTEGLPITSDRAKSIRTDFFAVNDEISTLHNKIMFDATKQGYLQTAYGRMRRFANPQAQRSQVLAFPGQSTACDVLIEKVILGTGRLVRDLWGDRSRLYFTVHDSGIHNIHGGAKNPKHGLEAALWIKQHMESSISHLDGFSIPVEVKIGPSWGQVMSLDKWKALHGIGDQVTSTAVGGI